jgi:hypothetical protein
LRSSYIIVSSLDKGIGKRPPLGWTYSWQPSICIANWTYRTSLDEDTALLKKTYYSMLVLSQKHYIKRLIFMNSAKESKAGIVKNLRAF